MRLLPDPPRNEALEAYLKQESERDIAKMLEPQHYMNVPLIDEEDKEPSDIIKLYM